MICNGCGGIVGRDCFNPPECEWISRDMEYRARYGDAEAAHYAQMEDAHERSQIEDALADGQRVVVIGHA